MNWSPLKKSLLMGFWQMSTSLFHHLLMMIWKHSELNLFLISFLDVNCCVSRKKSTVKTHYFIISVFIFIYCSTNNFFFRRLLVWYRRIACSLLHQWSEWMEQGRRRRRFPKEEKSVLTSDIWMKCVWKQKNKSWTLIAQLTHSKDDEISQKFSSSTTRIGGLND